MGGESAPQSESKSQMPQSQVGVLQQRPTTPMQFQRPFAAQPTAQPSMAELIAKGGTQARQNDPNILLQMLRQRG